MALAVHAVGAALVKIDAKQGAGLESLGYSINGVEITEESFFSDVPGDQNGGDEGPPISIQYFGEIARVRMELSNWDSTVGDKVRGKVPDTAAGVIGTVGQVIDGTGTNYYRLLILSTTEPQNFLFAIPRGAIEVNKGTKYSRFVCEWECHAVSAVLYNVNTT